MKLLAIALQFLFVVGLAACAVTAHNHGEPIASAIYVLSIAVMLAKEE